METKGFFIKEADFKVLEEKLSRLVRETGARCGLVVDKSGYLILASGEFPSLSSEDVGVMSAGALSALGKMVDSRTDHITVHFHTPKLETVHFSVLTPQVFLVVVIQSPEGKELEKEEGVRDACRAFTRDAKPLLEKQEIVSGELGSLDFVNKKLDEMFHQKEP